MQLRVFSAKDLKTALSEVKQELGPDAIILRQRKLWGHNALGLKGLEGFEVTAANLDEGETVESLRQAGLIDQKESLPESPPVEAPGIQPPNLTINTPASHDSQPPVFEDNANRFGSRRWGRAAYQQEQHIPNPDEPSAAPLARPPAPRRPSPADRASTGYSYDLPEDVPSMAPPEAPRVRETPPSSSPPAGAPSRPESSSDPASLRTELGYLRDEIREIRLGLKEMSSAQSPQTTRSRDPQTDASRVSTGRRRPTRVEKTVERLLILGLEPEYGRDLANQWFDAEEGAQPGTKSEIENAVQAGIAHLCQVNSDITRRPGEPRVIAFVGGTGVGKTTTIAKLAAREVLDHGRKAALLTCDNFRIAAVEQLRVYARIIGVPLKVVKSPTEMRNALRLYGSFDLILIDTPGLAPQLGEQFEELKQILSTHKRIEKFLTLNATTKTEEMLGTWNVYSQLGIDKLVICKTDETARFGCLLPLLHKAQLPVAFMTNGQRVPEDFTLATREGLLNLYKGVY